MMLKKSLAVAAAVAGLVTLAVAPQASAKTATSDGFAPVNSVLGLTTLPAAKRSAAAADAPTPVVIFNEWSQRCLDATGKTNGSAYQVWDCDSAPSEVAYLSENPEGYIRIQNAATGRYVEASKSVPGGGVNGTKVQLWDYVAGGKNQWWLPVQNAEGHWRLKNALSGRYLDASKSTPGGGVNGTKVQLWDLVSGGSNQWWPAYLANSAVAKQGVGAPRNWDW
jgi:hypothetical protein